MKIATWNVNSLRARLGRVTEWIELHQPDVLLMQETKCKDAAFPAEAFDALGYETAHHGISQWNGVAIVSRVGLTDIRSAFFDEQIDEVSEARVISATCGGVRLYSVYVPNGRTVGSEHYERKLLWLDHLLADLAASCKPEDRVGIFGDFNVAPEDRDVWDIVQFDGATHVTEAERAALSRLCEWGLRDAVRLLHPDEDALYSWWDYRSGSFHRGWGMRIDLGLISAPLCEGLTFAAVDREARRGPSPSDHAPLVIEVDLAR
jgi:exodeoxyribonuclease-3